MPYGTLPHINEVSTKCLCTNMLGLIYLWPHMHMWDIPYGNTAKQQWDQSFVLCCDSTQILHDQSTQHKPSVTVLVCHTWHSALRVNSETMRHTEAYFISTSSLLAATYWWFFTMCFELLCWAERTHIRIIILSSRFKKWVDNQLYLKSCFKAKRMYQNNWSIQVGRVTAVVMYECLGFMSEHKLEIWTFLISLQV